MAMEAVRIPAVSLPPKRSRLRAMPIPPERMPHRRRASGSWGSRFPKRRKKLTERIHLTASEIFGGSESHLM